MKVPSESLKNLRGGSYQPQKNWKNSFFDVFGGPITSPLKIFSDSEGTFIRQTFWVQQDPIEKKNWKIIIWGVNWKFRFLGFLLKTLKCLFCPLFDQKWKKIRMDSEKKWKVGLIKVTLFLLKNACGASYMPFYILSLAPLRRHFSIGILTKTKKWKVVILIRLV